MVSVRTIRSSRKERAPDREECQYVNCAETQRSRTSLIQENNKEKREKTQKEVGRWRRKVEGEGEAVI